MCVAPRAGGEKRWRNSGATRFRRNIWSMTVRAPQRAVDSETSLQRSKQRSRCVCGNRAIKLVRSGAGDPPCAGWPHGTLVKSVQSGHKEPHTTPRSRARAQHPIASHPLHLEGHSLMILTYKSTDFRILGLAEEHTPEYDRSCAC